MNTAAKNLSNHKMARRMHSWDSADCAMSVRISAKKLTLDKELKQCYDSEYDSENDW